MTENTLEEQLAKEIVFEQPQVIRENPKKKKNLGFLIFLPVLIILLGIAYYLGTLSSNMKSEEIVSIQDPIIEEEKTEKEVLVVYENKDINLNFSYPESWEIEESVGQKEHDQIFNTKVELSKDDALITMYFNMDGIGGSGQKYPGEEYDLDGYDLYKYKKTDDFSKRKQIGISNSLERTLGVFMINDITHMIVLSYPEDIETNEEEELLIEFDLILSTIDISEVHSGLVNSNDPLKVVENYLTAYVNKDWETAKSYVSDLDPQVTEGYDFVGYQITGSEENGDFYEVYVSFTDKDGKVWDKAPNDQGKLKVLMSKGVYGNWKPLTWYFYQ